MLSSALLDCAQMGWLPAEDVRWVATLGDRLRARTYARQVGGGTASRVLAEYQQALTEMAFLHHRVLQGTASPDYPERMLAIRARVVGLRPYVILPPSTATRAVSYPPGFPPPLSFTGATGVPSTVTAGTSVVPGVITTRPVSGP